MLAMSSNIIGNLMLRRWIDEASIGTISHLLSSFFFSFFSSLSCLLSFFLLIIKQRRHLYQKGRSQLDGDIYIPVQRVGKKIGNKYFLSSFVENPDWILVLLLLLPLLLERDELMTSQAEFVCSDDEREKKAFLFARCESVKKKILEKKDKNEYANRMEVRIWDNREESS